MGLTLYKRHTCGNKNRSDGFQRKGGCRCPIWVEGTIEGTYIRKATKTRSGERAEEIKREWEANRKPTEPSITIHEALQKFIKECEARNLNPRTLRKYEYLEKALGSYARDRGIVTLSDTSPDAVRDFRSSWKLSPRTQVKTLERLKSFFKFCVENDWITKNPAKNIKPPKIKAKAIEPYTADHFQAILKACEGKPRHRTLVLTLRYTGLRISDAVMLRRDALQGGQIRLYTQKTGTPVYCPVPPHVVSALHGCPNKSAQYFFATGESTNQTATNNWRDEITKILRNAKVHGSPHTFRHTFATALLSAGVSDTTVADLLGNSPAIVRKHYSHWMQQRQDFLTAEVQKTWSKMAVIKGRRTAQTAT